MRLHASILLAVLLPVVLSAQTITTEPLAQSAYCAGETITVDYTLTGAVNPGNAFILQLSNPDGGFDMGFQNVASVIATQSGSFNYEVPKDIVASTAYRFRVIASNPRVDGSDNGSDITLDPLPRTSFRIYSGVFSMGQVGGTFALVGDQIELKANGRVWWNFGIGSGASPEQTGLNRPTVSYSTPGIKNIRLFTYSPSGHCETTHQFTVTILPSNPVLPADVRIVQSEEVFDANNLPPRNIWVCPGGICRIENGGPEMVFVEDGGHFESESGLTSIIYLKEAGSVGKLHHFGGRIVSEQAMGTLTFDYSNVPPNGCPSLAPYTVQIKPDVRSIHTPEQEENSNTEYWLHNGGMLTSTGNGNTYYVEAGGRLVVNGVDSKIYVKDGGTVDVQQGSGHRIFYETKATLLNTGDDPILLPSSGITYTSQVSSVDVDATVGGSSSLVQIRPNPIRSRAEVRVDGSLGEINRVEVYDYVGRKAYEVEGVGESVVLDLGSYPRGVYHVRVVTSGGVVTSRIVLE